jgi:hypothetical protein
MWDWQCWISNYTNYKCKVKGCWKQAQGLVRREIIMACLDQFTIGGGWQAKELT